MSDWYIEYVTAIRRCEENVRRAEEDRMLRLQHAENLPGERFRWSDRLLSNIGDMLVTWGVRLQARRQRELAASNIRFRPKTYPE